MALLSITGALGSVGSGCLVDLEGSPQLVAPLGRIDVCYSALTPPLFLTPDFFQGFAELSRILGPRQVTSSKHAADPPHLKAAKHQGDQSKLDISPIHLLHFSNRLLNRVGCCHGNGVAVGMGSRHVFLVL